MKGPPFKLPLFENVKNVEVSNILDRKIAAGHTNYVRIICNEVFEMIITGLWKGELWVRKTLAKKVWVYAKYGTNFNEGYWLVPVQVNDNESVELDLNNNNFRNESGHPQTKTMEMLRDTIEKFVRTLGSRFLSAQFVL